MEKRNKRPKKLLNIFLSILIILIFSESVSSLDPYVIMKMCSNNGNYKVYYDQPSSFTPPDEILINGIKQENTNSIQYFISEEINVTLIWKNPITSCKEMFKDCEDIIEMDFSHFDISQVTDMFGMFNNCNKLKSLDLSNFVNSKVTGNNIAFMFS